MSAFPFSSGIPSGKDSLKQKPEGVLSVPLAKVLTSTVPPPLCHFMSVFFVVPSKYVLFPSHVTSWIVRVYLLEFSMATCVIWSMKHGQKCCVSPVLFPTAFIVGNILRLVDEEAPRRQHTRQTLAGYGMWK